MKKLPKILTFLFRLILPERIRNTAIGDYEEIYANLYDSKGRINAHSWLWSQIFRSIPGYFIDQIRRNNIMFKNYLKVAVRNLTRQKGFSFISISGLAIGMACCVLMFLWLQNELSYDVYHENADEIYRVIFEKQKGNRHAIDSRGANAIGPNLKENYPEIINFTRFRSVMGWPVQSDGDVYENDMMSVADPTIFEIFSFDFISGDPSTALTDPRSVVVTKSLANKYFGDSDPLGKILKIASDDYEVSAVIEDVPKNSHLQFDYVMPIVNMEDAWGDPLDSWTRDFRFTSFIQLQEGSNWKDISDKLSKSNIVREHHPESSTESIFLQPLKNIHLGSAGYGLDFSGKGSKKTVYILVSSALCILLIACINFMNLSTARASSRIKEIGVRKVIGAERKDLIKQFFGESAIICLISLIFSLVLAYLFLPVFNELTTKSLSLDISSNIQIIYGLLGITVLTGLASGAYPALFLSSFQPGRVLKGMILSKIASRETLRKTLVTAQFVVTIALILGTTIIYRQLDYMQNKDLGYDKENLINLDLYGLGRDIKTIKNELLKNPDILNISGSLPPTGLFGLNSNRRELDWSGKDPSLNVLTLRYGVDYEYLDTYRMKMAEGRFFAKEFATDSSNYILNESAVKAMGIESPVGKWFSYDGRRGMIIGVIKDYHQTSLRSQILPQILFLGGRSFSAAVRLNSENISETIAFLEKKWVEFEAQYPLSYNFYDEQLNRFYSRDEKTGRIIRYFTSIALIISCLGMFGLVTFMAAQRTKEFGIRKVLGASVTSVVLLMSKELTKSIIFASIISWPIGYYLMSNWLENFSYKISLNVTYFIFSGLLAVIISLLIISYKAIKTARTNPVNSLRYE